MIRNSKNIFSKEKEISKQDIYDFFVKEGIDSVQRGTRLLEYFGVVSSQGFFEEFYTGDNKILIVNPGEDLYNELDCFNSFALTKEAKREAKINLIINNK